MEFTENQLAGAIETARLDAMDENDDLGRLSSSAVAARIAKALGSAPSSGWTPAPPAASPELDALAAVLGALEKIADPEARGLATGPVWRVLRFAAEVHGYVTCTED